MSLRHRWCSTSRLIMCMKAKDVAETVAITTTTGNMTTVVTVIKTILPSNIKSRKARFGGFPAFLQKNPLSSAHRRLLVCRRHRFFSPEKTQDIAPVRKRILASESDQVTGIACFEQQVGRERRAAHLGGANAAEQHAHRTWQAADV